MINTKKSYYKGYKDEKKDLQGYIQQSKQKIKSGESYKNPTTGKTYTTSHYKKALAQDQARLKQVNQALKDEKVGTKLSKSKSSSTKERRLKKYD